METIVAKKKKKAIVLRELQQTVECANKLSTLFYSIFLLPTNTGITQKLMMQGKQNAQAIKLHPHSIGVSPLFAFGMLLLLAADMLNNKPEIKKAINITCDLNSRHMLNQLCQIANCYNINIRKSALTFMVGHAVERFHPLALAEIKLTKNCPWALTLSFTDSASIPGSNSR